MENKNSYKVKNYKVCKVKMQNKNNFSILILMVFLVAGFFLISHSVSKNNPVSIKQVKIAGVIVKVDLALTKNTQEQGLSGRQNLNDDEGMLFVFDHPDKYLFWMKNMNFPIDIIWIGEDLQVVYIKKDARPELYLETYGPDKDAKYVLEVVSGFSERNNLKVGDVIKIIFCSIISECQK